MVKIRNSAKKAEKVLPANMVEMTMRVMTHDVIQLLAAFPNYSFVIVDQVSGCSCHVITQFLEVPHTLQNTGLEDFFRLRECNAWLSTGTLTS